jgi:hypothetical protein
VWGDRREDIEKATKRQARRSRRKPEEIAEISAAAVALNCEWALPQVRVDAASGESTSILSLVVTLI